MSFSKDYNVEYENYISLVNSNVMYFNQYQDENVIDNFIGNIDGAQG